MVPGGEPGRLVEQDLGPVVVQLEVLGPRECPQPDDQRLGTAGGTGSVDDLRRRRPVRLWVDKHALVGGLGFGEDGDAAR